MAQIEMELKIVAENTIDPQSIKRDTHLHMQCLFDPTGMIPRGWGLYRVFEFRESFHNWAEGSFWQGIGGEGEERIYCKRGRFLIISDDDHLQRVRQSHRKRASQKGTRGEFLYT